MVVEGGHGGKKPTYDEVLCDAERKRNSDIRARSRRLDILPSASLFLLPLWLIAASLRRPPWCPHGPHLFSLASSLINAPP